MLQYITPLLLGAIQYGLCLHSELRVCGEVVVCWGVAWTGDLVHNPEAAGSDVLWCVGTDTLLPCRSPVPM